MKLRRVIQAFVFVLVLATAIGHSMEESGVAIPFVSSASLHAVCPFGGVVSIYEFFASGSYVKKVHESSFILMFIVFALAIVLGPVFCGWICPFGTFQEWVAGIGKKIFKKKFNRFIPYKVDKYLRYTRYFFLLMVVVKTAQTAELMFQNIDPYYALFSIWTDEVAITAYVVLGITVLASLFVERPFCKYVCPYGALLGLTNLFKVFKIKRVASTCISCKICDNKCPMNIPLSTADVSKNHQCISCLECTSEAACPKGDTMVLSFKDKVLKSKFVGIITVGLFILGIGGSMIFNIWNTESSKIPVKYSGTQFDGEFEGEYNPSDIRGSYSLKDVENAFKVPVEELARAFAFSAVHLADSRVKDMAERFEFEGDIEVGTDAVRLFVAIYRGLPYEPEETTRLFRPALSVLKHIDKEQRDYVNSIIIEVPGGAGNVQIAEHIDTEEVFIKGKTTFYDVINMGVSKDFIKEVLGELPENLKMTVRDYATENGISFSELKAELQEKK